MFKLTENGKRLASRVGLGASAFALAGAAMASGGGGVDVSAATDAFTQVETAVKSIGGVMLLAAGAGIVYKWVTAFLL